MKWESIWTKLLRDYRYYVIPKSYAIRKKLLEEKKFVPQEGKRIIYFDCKKSRVDGVSGRRLHHLVTLFEAANCQVVIRAGIPMVGNFFHQKFKKRLLEKHQISFVKDESEIQQPYITVADYQCDTLPRNCEKWITLLFEGDFDETNHLMLPFPLFPDAYEGESPTLFRGAIRDKGILFAGSTQPNYDRESVQEIYHCLPRQKTLHLIQKKLSGENICNVTDVTEIHSITKNQLCVLENHLVKIPEKDWMPILSSFNFFLCLPGTRYPMCHNAVESLAIGTIPILEYPKHFYPPLEDGLNCLVFHGEDSLLEILQKAVTLKESDISKIRQAAMEYYDEYLDLKNVAEKILSDSRKKVYLHTTYHALPQISSW